jgi:deoxyribose-phosphate aldolase
MKGLKKRFLTGGLSGVASLIDHTLLKPDASFADVTKLCREAKQHGFYSVCVNPANIDICRRLLRNSQVKICAVVGFPLGASTAYVKEYEAKEAVKSGADEIDMVVNIGALKSGDFGLVSREIKLVRKAIPGKTLKVIIETGLLTREEKIATCLAAMKGGADFVKTSTGFAAGATARDVRLIRNMVGSSMGIKASGGIKTAGRFFKMLAAGATRIGTSSAVHIMKTLKGADNKYNKSIGSSR